MTEPYSARSIGEAGRGAVVGRRREIEEISATLSAGRDLLLEGPPGTSKSTLLRTVAGASRVPFVMVEGNADLTPAKLVGYHDPSGVVAHGYRPEDFAWGPLTDAMRRGALLYVEEFNRVPDDTLNVLLGPLAEREIEVPRVGTVRAEPGFRLIAAMNPFDNVGTMRVSRSILDRLCRLPVGYQPEGEEREIVRLRSGSPNGWLIEGAVSLVRASRAHPELRMGSSVRGAIDLVLVAENLAPLRDTDLRAASIRGASNAAKDVALDAALISLSGRMVPDETAQRPPEAIVRELWEDVFYFRPQRARGERALDGRDNPVTAPAGRPRRRRGPVVMPSRPRERVSYPKPGKVKEPPRVYRPNEMALLATERSAGPTPPRSAGEFRRDHPAAREVLAEDERFDRAAFEELYERDEEAALSLLGDLWPNAADEKLRELTRKMALKIVVRLARHNPTASPGRGKLRPVRYRFNSDDLDIDRTLEEIAGKPYPEYDDFWVTERVRARRTYVLLLDVSGSMRGTKMMHAALAAASLARNVADDDFSVILFWRDAAVVKGATQQKPFAELLDDILAARARGLTNLRLGLEVGLGEMERTATREKVAIIFTDAMHNVGEDPSPIAEKYQTLHVIGTSLEDGRVRACQDLAERGRGRCVFVEHMEDIPSAVNYCLSGA
ncbi:AAA family ATPase [Rubrobacter marinus]|uniref:AAA family ATPase n=1 Tax=Rubrobacter marinus TaxID=2653852 RepID=UPI001409EC95|nr:AAA family ATPase [Rubrobacter marinus]